MMQTGLSESISDRTDNYIAMWAGVGLTTTISSDREIGDQPGSPVGNNSTFLLNTLNTVEIRLKH